MDLNNNKRLQAVDRLLHYLSENDTLNQSHYDTLIKNLSRKPGLEGSAKSRDKTSGTLLAGIYNELGYEALFLCAIAIRPTQLGTAKEEFLRQFREWWKKSKIPDRFRSIAQTLELEYKDLMPKVDSPTRKHEREITEGTEVPRKYSRIDITGTRVAGSEPVQYADLTGMEDGMLCQISICSILTSQKSQLMESHT